MFCKIGNFEHFNKDPRTPAQELIPSKATDQKPAALLRMNSQIDELPKTPPKFTVKKYWNLADLIHYEENLFMAASGQLWHK